MKQMWLVAVMLFALTGAVAAQDALSPYEEALRRIEAARVSGATELNLSDLGLTSVPPEIGALTQLESLSLGGNTLTALPPEIGALTQLEALNLNNNALTALPPEIGALTQLEQLGLRDNALTALPLEIGTLSNLERLWIHNNQLTVLPPQLGYLPNLRELSVSGNPLTFPPPDVVEQGRPAILDYLGRPQPPHTPTTAFWVALVGCLFSAVMVVRILLARGRMV